MATVKEIAEKCGVSIGTVDRVLHNRGRVNAETRRRVLEVAEQLQYVPNRAAQSLAVRKRKLHLGFIAQCQKGHPFFDDINRAAQKKAEELKEFGVTVTFLYNDVYVSEEGFLKSRLNIPEGFSLDSLDGLVSPGITTAMYRPDGSRRSFPVAYYNIAPENHNELLSVSCDYFKSGTIAAGLCALTGGDHATIAIITEGQSNHQVQSYQQRVEGFSRRIADGLLMASVVFASFATYFLCDETKSYWCYERFGLLWGILLLRYLPQIRQWLSSKRVAAGSTGNCKISDLFEKFVFRS